MIIDAGPMISICDRRQPAHNACLNLLYSTPNLITTWPCLTEAMHLVHRLGGHPLQQHLWNLFDRQLIQIHRPTDEDRVQIATLMARYQNVPMDLADASLIALANSTRQTTIITLDSDFRIYRLFNGQAPTIFPV